VCWLMRFVESYASLKDIASTKCCYMFYMLFLPPCNPPLSSSPAYVRYRKVVEFDCEDQEPFTTIDLR
jgi:hypothetical protein